MPPAAAAADGEDARLDVVIGAERAGGALVDKQELGVAGRRRTDPLQLRAVDVDLLPAEDDLLLRGEGGEREEGRGEGK